MNATIWLTKYDLDNIRTTGQTMRLYQQRKRLHSVSMSLFGDPLVKAGRAEKNILWRIEDDTASPYLLIQSTVPPTEEASALPHVHSKPIAIDTILDTATTVIYRIAMSTAYNTRPVTGPENPNPKTRLANASRDHNKERWHTRATNHGLNINTTDLKQRRITVNNPHHEPSMNNMDIFTGTATITDTDALVTAIRRGIGKHKAWGCGLLTVAPQRN